MKVATILLVCAIVHGKNIELNQNGCPIDYTIEKLYAHNDCNKYYQCTHGNLVERMCFMELLFNVDTQKCDWPHDVDCGNRIIPDANEVDNNGNGSGSGNGDNNGSGNGNGNGSGNGSGNENNGSCNCECTCPGPNENGNGNSNENENDNGNGDGNDNGSGDGGNCNGDGNNNGSGDGGNGNGDNGNGNDGSCNCNPGEAPSICGRPGSSGVLVAHEDCNKFYKCDHGLPSSQDCPGNLLYNPLKEVCDWPQNVDCGDRIIPDPNENGNGNGNENGNGNGDGGNGNGDNGNGNDGSCNCNPGEAPSICGKPGSSGVLVAHEDCNKFYKCDHGLPSSQDCPGNLLYNPLKEVCDWPQNVDCGDRIIPDPNENGNGNGNENGNGNGDGGNSNGDNGNGNDGSCNCNPGEAPSICGKPGSSGVLVAHEDCNKFYKCDHGLPSSQDCPGNLLYNPLKEVCDWPQNVDCGDRIIPDPNENGNGNGNENGNGNGDGGNGNGDNGNGNDGSCNCNPGEAPSICGKPGSSGVLVAHEDCNKFYKCDHGLPYSQDCPGNLLYNPLKEVCDWPQNVDCGDRIIPDPNENGNGNGNENGNGNGDGGNGNGDNGNGNDGSCNCNPGEAPSICGKPGSSGVLVAHEDCNKFYKCDHGLPSSQDCPGNLLYNPLKEVCDWPQNVDCGDRIIPDPNENGNGNGNENGNGNGDGGNGNGDNGNGNDGSCNCNPGEAPSICGKPGSSGVLVAHEDCNKFYKCDHGLPSSQDCPGNLLYNPLKEVCDWPQNVDCGDRIIPEPENGNDNGNVDNGNVGETNSNENSNNGNNTENSSCEDNNVEENESENDNGSNGDTCYCNPQEAIPICQQDGSDGIHIAHEHCTKYYRCISGIAIPMPCPLGLHYNPYIEVCDWPYNVDCADRIIPDPSDIESEEDDDSDENKDVFICNCNPEEAPLICARNNSNNVLVASENCNQYYICDNGKPTIMDCPGNLLYNPYKEVCDWPQDVDCGERVIPDPKEIDNGNNGGNENSSENDINRPCNCDPDQAEAICAAENSESTLIAHEICNKYYICNFGLPVTQKCQDNLLYNPYKEICDWSANVDCGNRLRPRPNDTDEGSCNCTPSKAPSICADENSNGVVVAHENCHQYYKCLNRRPMVLSCFSSWLFNPYKQQCDRPENVNCGHRFRINN